jgi:hypothetical protein
MVRRMWRFTAAVSAATVLWAAVAAAQTDNRFAIGGGVTTRVAGSGGASSSATGGIDVRLGHDTEEWGWAYSFFSWFDTNLDARPTIPGELLGRLRMRPVMVGYGYKWGRGRYTIAANTLAGFSFNSFDLDPAARAAYVVKGAGNINAEVSNSFAVKPEVEVWYDVSPRIGIKLSGGYLISRPTITVTSTLGQDMRPVRADTILITISAVYSIF